MPLRSRIDLKDAPCPSASFPNRSSTASPPARWSSVRRAWSRNWWRTPSTPAPAAIAENVDPAGAGVDRSEEHTSELQSLRHLVCRLLLGKKDKALREVDRLGKPIRV